MTQIPYDSLNESGQVGARDPMRRDPGDGADAQIRRLMEHHDKTVAFQMRLEQLRREILGLPTLLQQTRELGLAYASDEDDWDD